MFIESLISFTDSRIFKIERIMRGTFMMLRRISSAGFT